MAECGCEYCVDNNREVMYDKYAENRCPTTAEKIEKAKVEAGRYERGMPRKIALNLADEDDYRRFFISYIFSNHFSNNDKYSGIFSNHFSNNDKYSGPYAQRRDKVRLIRMAGVTSGRYVDKKAPLTKAVHGVFKAKEQLQEIYNKEFPYVLAGLGEILTHLLFPLGRQVLTGAEKTGEARGQYPYVPSSPGVLIYAFREDKDYSKGKKWIDIGCGAGAQVFNACLFTGMKCTGFEYDSSTLRVARRIKDKLIYTPMHGKLTFLRGDAITFKKFSTYDRVFTYIPLSDYILLELFYLNIWPQLKNKSMWYEMSMNGAFLKAYETVGAKDKAMGGRIAWLPPGTRKRLKGAEKRAHYLLKCADKDCIKDFIRRDYFEHFGYKGEVS